MISIDGVMQAPGGPDEDPSGGFNFGGWTRPFGDKIYGEVVLEELQPAEYLLGRKTFEIWENYWPNNTEFWPSINEGNKYVVSSTRSHPDWNNTIFLKSVDTIKNLKNSEGMDIQTWGSSKLVQTLFEHNLVDEIRLKIHPVILGKGKRLFDNGSVPTNFSLKTHLITTTGVIIAHYTKSDNLIEPSNTTET